MRRALRGNSASRTRKRTQRVYASNNNHKNPLLEQLSENPSDKATLSDIQIQTQTSEDTDMPALLG
jgi:hypothetical protein